MSLSLSENNCTVINGYFYSFDTTMDALVQKTSDGTIAFTYPTDVVLSNIVESLEFDGIYFWSLEIDSENDNSIIIRKWYVENYICKLITKYDFIGDTLNLYNSNSFTVEHYHTVFSSNALAGDTTLYIKEYYNFPDIINDAIINLGPNSNGESESVRVVGTDYKSIIIDTPIVYSYLINDNVQFSKYLYIFNNFNGTDDTTGAIYKIDCNNGSLKTKFVSGSYKNITATTFSKISSLSNVGDNDMLLYVKGTNILFVNTSEVNRKFVSSYIYNDDFNNADNSPIDNNKWVQVEGSNKIYQNSLYSTLDGSVSVNSIKSVCYINDDFDIVVYGSTSSFDNTYNGDGYFNHTLKILYPFENNRFYSINFGYNTKNNINKTMLFYSDEYTDTYTVISGVSSNITEYKFRIKKVNNVIFYFYKTIDGGVESNWYELGSSTAFDTDAVVVLESSNNVSYTYTTLFDNFIINNDKVIVRSSANDISYFGSMKVDEFVGSSSALEVTDMSVESGNVFCIIGHDYVFAPLYPFVTSISLTANPAVLPANGVSKSTIRAIVKDQFLQPVKFRRVTFDRVDVTPQYINTDENGEAVVEYTSSTIGGEVKIEAIVEQV